LCLRPAALAAFRWRRALVRLIRALYISSDMGLPSLVVRTWAKPCPIPLVTGGLSHLARRDRLRYRSAALVCKRGSMPKNGYVSWSIVVESWRQNYASGRTAPQTPSSVANCQNPGGGV
jgi:hypothetical protein